MRACMHSCAPEGMNKMNWLDNFQFLYMTLAIDIIDGCGLSNEVSHEPLADKGRPSNAVFIIYFILRDILAVVY